MRLFWAILLFATQFERCAAPFCELFPIRDHEVTIAQRLGIRDVVAVLPVGDEVILVSAFDNFPGTNDERTIWRWSESRGLEEIRKLTEYEVEHDKLTPYGANGWFYSFEADRGIYVVTDKEQLQFIKTPRLYPMFHYPLRAAEPRILVVNYLTNNRMGAAEVGLAGTPLRRWTFPSPPGRSTLPASWSATLLDDERIAFLSHENGVTSTSPWRLILRILGDSEAVEEHVLREVKPSVFGAMAARGSTVAILSRGERFQYSIFDLSAIDTARWRDVTVDSQASANQQLIATKETFIAAWTSRPTEGDWQVRAIDLGGGIVARDVAPLLNERDRLFLRLREADGKPLLFYGNPDVVMRELTEPLSGMELLEHICDRFAAWRSSD